MPLDSKKMLTTAEAQIKSAIRTYKAITVPLSPDFTALETWRFMSGYACLTASIFYEMAYDDSYILEHLEFAWKLALLSGRIYRVTALYEKYTKQIYGPW